MLNATSARKNRTGKIKIDKCRFSYFFLTFFRYEGRKKIPRTQKMLFSGQGQKIESSFFGANLEKNGSDRVSGKKFWRENCLGSFHNESISDQIFSQLLVRLLKQLRLVASKLDFF